MKNFDTLGVMIDCSRNAVANVEGLKKFLGTISKMGYNMAMLYTEDTYEVEGEPYFGYKRGRYSVDELREIDAYAASVGIELVPCIQTLAHLGSILRWRAYKYKVGDIDDILMVDEPRTYELIENMFSSLEKSFRSRRVHIGMDEAGHVGLGRYLDAHGYTEKYELLLRHLSRVCDIARKHGFEMMMWNDMFFHLLKNPSESTEVAYIPSEISDKIPKDCAMVYWTYFPTDEARYDAMLKSSKLLSDNVWFAGGAWTWGGFAPHNKYSIKRNEIALASCIKNGVRNAFLTLWGDSGGECPYESVLPALMHAAAIADGMSDGEMKARFKDITGEDFDRFLELDLPNYIYGEDVPVESPYLQNSACNYSKAHLYDDPFLAMMTGHLKEYDKELFRDYAARLHASAAQSNTYSYLYESLACLCDALYVKFPLAAKTREVYARGDREELRALAENDYTEALALVRRFYEVYRRQWMSVNKSYGFEIQDVRLGGLMCRIENCKHRLLQYANGEIARIEELEEQVLPIGDTCVPSYAEMVSANWIV